MLLLHRGDLGIKFTFDLLLCGFNQDSDLFFNFLLKALELVFGGQIKHILLKHEVVFFDLLHPLEGGLELWVQLLDPFECFSYIIQIDFSAEDAFRSLLGFLLELAA